MTPRMTEAQAHEFIDGLELAIYTFLEEQTRSPDVSASRNVARHVLLELAGRVVLSDIETRGDEARRAALAEIDALRLHVSTHGLTRQ